jgi:TRAP-type C4-dicarboxylate transport system permease small subunit
MSAALKRMSSATLVVSGLALLVMMVQVSADVTLKYLFNKAIPGTLELVSTYYMVAGVFLPIAAVEFVRASISVDVAYQFLPRWMKIVSMTLVLVASIAVYLVLAYTSLGDALESLRRREMMMGNVFVSVWASRFVLPVSFGLAGVVCIAQLWGFMTDPKTRAGLLATSDTTEEI